MDFVAVVDQVIALLRQRGRVAYRTLQRQFQLDDEALADLKIELIDAQHLARDEQGSVLVWLGEPGSPLAPPATPEAAGAQTPLPSAAPAMPEAERRQLTVLFCDLVDSTALSSQLDPEDLREVVRAYQDTCATVIARFDGHIAQYLGDGLLIYFGYPLAHEDDAQRAVRAGLGMVEALGPLNTRLEEAHGVRLAVRLGIHTGLVVVGEVGSGARQEQLALGETPNLAARLQGLATPDTVVISAATAHLIHGYFVCQPLGAHALKGLAQPLEVSQVLRESGAQTRLDVAIPRGLTPLVGREQEVGLLRERWGQVQDRRGQVIILSGEAGIGKSRLGHVLTEYVADAPHTRWECRCSPYYHNTALYPLIDVLQRALHWPLDEPVEAKLDKLEYLVRQSPLPLDEAVPLLATLLSLPLPAERYPPLALLPQLQRQKTFEALLAVFGSSTLNRGMVRLH